MLEHHIKLLSCSAASVGAVICAHEQEHALQGVIWFKALLLRMQPGVVGNQLDVLRMTATKCFHQNVFIADSTTFAAFVIAATDTVNALAPTAAHSWRNHAGTIAGGDGVHAGGRAAARQSGNGGCFPGARSSL